MGADYSAAKAFDNHNGTLWAAPAGKPTWIKADLGKIKTIKYVVPVFDIIAGDYVYTIEYSANNKDWKIYDSLKNSDAAEWPHASKKTLKARYVRLTIKEQTKEPKRIGLWELKIY